MAQAVVSKRCPKCEQTKDAAAFNRNRGSYDGLQPYCRECSAVDARKRAKNIRDRRIAGELPTVAVDSKHCSRCDTVKPAGEIGVRLASPDGLSSWCKSCHRDHQNLRKYDLTPEEFRELAEKQNGRCAICFESAPLVVDHSHETGQVRGLLCGKCNSTIGYARDNITILEAAINYIKESKR